MHSKLILAPDRCRIQVHKGKIFIYLLYENLSEAVYIVPLFHVVDKPVFIEPFPGHWANHKRTCIPNRT